MIQKIISGGQTGVDRAALDAAIKLTIPHGGWIPQGRLTENGPLPLEYQLKETRNPSYADRTEKNVQDADYANWYVPSDMTGLPTLPEAVSGS